MDSSTDIICLGSLFKHDNLAPIAWRPFQWLMVLLYILGILGGENTHFKRCAKFLLYYKSSNIYIKILQSVSLQYEPVYTLVYFYTSVTYTNWSFKKTTDILCFPLLDKVLVEKVYLWGHGFFISHFSWELSYILSTSCLHPHLGRTPHHVFMLHRWNG